MTDHLPVKFKVGQLASRTVGGFSLSFRLTALLISLVFCVPGMLALWPVAAAAQELDPSIVLARVHFADWRQLNAVAGELDIWEVHHDQGYFVAALTAADVARLRLAGMQVTPTAEFTPAISTEQASAGAPGGIPGYACYRTVEETYSGLADLAADHPDLAEWIDIGDSWDKLTPDGAAGFDLHALVLTNRLRPGPKFKFALMAAIHAREFTTAETATRFAEELVANYGVDPDVTWLLDYGEMHILPQANPDGRKFAEQLIYWRKNTNRTFDCPGQPSSGYQYGVDLNRNSSFKWNECEGSSCSSSAVCAQTYRGVSAASEPETQVIETYLGSIFADQRGPAVGDAAPPDTEGVFISLHSYGQWVLFPWGYTASPSPNFSSLQTLGRKFGYFTKYDVCQAGAPGCIYQTDGTTDDWSYGALGVASFTLELGTSFFQSCSYFEQTILPVVRPALLTAFKAARRPYQTPSGPDALQLAVSSAQVIAGQPVTLSAVLDDTRVDGNAPQFGIEPTQPISAARYTIDAPSWITATALLPMNVVSGAVDAKIKTMQSTIDTTGWSPGRHLLFVEGQDASGAWGAPSAAWLTILPVEQRAVAAIVLPPATSGRPGNAAHSALVVTNQGALTDTYTIAITSRWPISAPATIGPLAALQQASLPLTISVPLTASVGMSDTATIHIESLAEQSISAELVLTTEAVAHRLLLPLIISQ
jgi:carboxypeptidase T